MRASLHFFLSATDAKLTLWQRGTLIWESASKIESGNIAQAITSLLATVPSSRWRLRFPVIITLGTQASRTKHLKNLPPVPHPEMLNTIVRENAHQFFLWRSAFVTTDVHPVVPGEAIGAILDASVVETVVSACESSGYAVRAIRPEQDERLTYRPPLLRLEHRRLTPVRRVAAWGGLVFALIAAITAPVIAAHRAVRQANRELAVITPKSQETVTRLHSLDSDAQAIRAVSQFEEGRRSTALLLASITDMLPSESAITLLRIDTATVDLVVISAHAADVLRALDQMQGVVAPEIVGPVSREVSGERELERATIRFRYHPQEAQDVAKTVYNVSGDGRERNARSQLSEAEYTTVQEAQGTEAHE